MNDDGMELLTRLYEEFSQFKTEINEKINDLIVKEDNDYRIFEDIVDKIGELKYVIEANHVESIEEQKEILESLSEKIAMLMLRK